MATRAVRKPTRKKTAAKKKTTTRREALTLTSATVKKVAAARKKGKTWAEIEKEFGFSTSQVIGKVRPALKEFDASLVSDRGRGSPNYGKGGAKKTTSKKTAKKTTAKKKSTGKKKVRRVARGGGSPKAVRSDLKGMPDQAIIEHVSGATVSFYRNARDKELSRGLVTDVVREAKMLPESKDFGRIVQMRLKGGRIHSIPLDFIKKVK